MTWEDQLNILYDHIRQSERRLLTLRNLDKEIVSREKPPDQLLSWALETLVDLTTARSIYILRNYVDHYKLALAAGEKGALAATITLPSAAEKWRSASYDRHEAPSELLACLPDDVKAILISKLQEGDSASIVVSETPFPTFKNDDRDFIHDVLGQLAIALRGIIENRKLSEYKDLHNAFFAKDLDQHEVLTTLSTRVLSILSDNLSEPALLLQILFTEIQPPSDSKPTSPGRLRILWSTNPGDNDVIVPMESFSGQAMAQSQPYQIGDPSRPPHNRTYKAFANFKTRTELAIPLRGAGFQEAFGVLNVESPLPNAFSDSTIWALREVVEIVSPILHAIRRRIEMAIAQQKSVASTVDTYLSNIRDLYDHKFRSHTVALRLNIDTAVDSSPSDPELPTILRGLRDEIIWIETQLKELWGEISSVTEITPINLAEIIDEFIDEERTTADRYLRIDPGLASLPEVKASRLVKEHLRNIIVNSVKALERKEESAFAETVPAILISGSVQTAHQTSHIQTDTGAVAALNRRVRLSIRDNGIGADPDQREQLLQPGYSEFGGKGYGLDAVRRYLRELGGDLRIESQAGVFFEVQLEFPVFQDASALSSMNGTESTK